MLKPSYIVIIDTIKNRRGVMYLKLSKKIMGMSLLTMMMLSLTGCEFIDKIKQPSPMFIEAQNESMKSYVNGAMKDLEERVLAKTKEEVSLAEERIVQLITSENEALENTMNPGQTNDTENKNKVEQSTAILAVLPEENSFEKLEVLGVKSSIYAAILASQSQTVEALKPVLSESLLKKEDLKSFIDIVFANIDDQTMVEKIIVKTLANNTSTVDVYKQGQDKAQLWTLVKSNNQWLIDNIDVSPITEETQVAAEEEAVAETTEDKATKEANEK